MSSEHQRSVEKVFRASSGAITASLIRFCGDFDLAEDAVQEAFIVAVEDWERNGIPPNPGGWIATTAKRRLIDHLRRDRRRHDRENLVSQVQTMPDDLAENEDDRLRLVLTCCHPALPLDVRVALTLRTVAGLSTAQIAESFLVPEATMAKRLTRGKRKIQVAGISYAVPPAEVLDSRLPAVLAVVYLVFNAGYNAVARREDESIHLIDQAVSLARNLDLLVPNEPEIKGLLALMLLHASRSAARFDDGSLALLADQDRENWDEDLIAEAFGLVALAPRLGGVGQYWLQAAIAAEHIGPSNAADKNWLRIVALYDRLVDQTRGSVIVQLNRAIALAEAHGPAAGLAAAEPLAQSLADYPYFHSAVADFHRRAGNNVEAAVAYRQAIALSPAKSQRDSLSVALAEIEGTEIQEIS